MKNEFWSFDYLILWSVCPIVILMGIYCVYRICQEYKQVNIEYTLLTIEHEEIIHSIEANNHLSYRIINEAKRNLEMLIILLRFTN